MTKLHQCRNQTHGICRRCGRHAFHLTHRVCSSCKFPISKRRNFKK